MNITSKYLISTLSLTGLFLAGCATTSQDSTQSYDLADQPVSFSNRIALPRTRLEPIPTSYVLFPSPAVADLPSTSPTTAQINAWNALNVRNVKERKARVKEYCKAHLRRFQDDDTVTAADSFANRLFVFWPVTKEVQYVGAYGSGDGVVTLNDLSLLDLDCTNLADHYDFDRADFMLASFEQYVPAQKPRGPIMVMDLGFDAILASFDNLKDNELADVPSNWVINMRSAFQEADNKRSPLINRRGVVLADIAKLEEKKRTSSLSGSEKDKLKDLKKELKKLTKKLFEKNGVGHGIACALGGGVLGLAGATIPGTEILEEKLEGWCEVDDD